MISQKGDAFLELKGMISKQKKIAREMLSVQTDLKDADENEKEMLSEQLTKLKKALAEANKNIGEKVGNINLVKPLSQKKESAAPLQKQPVQAIPEKIPAAKGKAKFTEAPVIELDELEKEAMKRYWKKGKVVPKKKEEKPRAYLRYANQMFSEYSERLIKKDYFRGLKRELVKADIQLVPKAYLSIVFFTTFLAAIAAVIIIVFLLFFSIGPALPIITFSEEFMLERLWKLLWIFPVLPAVTFLMVYIYPSMEKRSKETKINEEIPFATIHMSAISSSLTDPTKIFGIIISTGEYPNIGREFTKLLNQINIYGYDLVSVLRELSFNTPSSKLSELLNGLSTTINSGGDLSIFFDKRAGSLLFEHKLEQEKRNKAAETFMDIYISVVIAAPMIFMLLLMMMKISGLGISLSTSMISLVMVLGVSMVNIGFLTFLHLKQ